MGRIVQRKTKYKYRKSKVGKASNKRPKGTKRCSKCGRFL